MSDEQINGILNELDKEIDLNNSIIHRGFDFFASDIDNDKDRLAILLHLILLQNGFRFSYEPNESTKFLNQKKSSLYNKLFYNQVLLKSKKIHFELKSSLIITLLKNGNMLNINLKYGLFDSVSFCVNLKEFFFMPKVFIARKSDFTEVARDFSVNFKNKVLNPLKQFIKTNENFAVSGFYIHITDLPYEILFKIIIKYLDLKSIKSLMLTSKYLNDLINYQLTSKASIWNSLIQRDFKDDQARELNCRCFKEKYKRLRDYRKSFEWPFNLTYQEF